MSGFSREQARIILERDGRRCAMCGKLAQVANHRANRGHGGHLASNRISNGCALCDDCNGRIEADAQLANEARRRGVKISRYDDPTSIPYLHPILGLSVYLDDTGGVTIV